MERPDLDITIRLRVDGTLNDVHLRKIFAYIAALEAERDELTNDLAWTLELLELIQVHGVEQEGQSLPKMIERLRVRLEREG